MNLFGFILNKKNQILLCADMARGKTGVFTWWCMNVPCGSRVCACVCVLMHTHVCARVCTHVRECN